MTDFAHFININASAHINVKTAGTIENPTVSAAFLLANDSNFDRNRVRGCNFGSEGGAVLNLGGCNHGFRGALLYPWEQQ